MKTVDINIFTILLLFLAINKFYANSQSPVTSKRYGYKIEIPRGFTPRLIVGRNVDLKVANSDGSSLVVVVKKLPTGSEEFGAHDMNSVSQDQLRSMLGEYGDKVEILAKGNTYINGQPAFYIRYNHDNFYAINYMLVKGEYTYTIHTECAPIKKGRLGPVFFRAIQSFTF